jgi:hypothetical protein
LKLAGSVLAKKININSREFDISQQQCPLKEAATEGKCKFLLTPARNRCTKGASQKRTRG